MFSQNWAEMLKQMSVKKGNNVGIDPLVSMATETRDRESCLEKATPVLHRVI